MQDLVIRQLSARGTSLTIKPYTNLQYEILTATKETSEECDPKINPRFSVLRPYRSSPHIIDSFGFSCVTDASYLCKNSYIS